MKLEIRRLEDLRPAEYNPRKALQPSDPEYQQIKESIGTLGYCDPIVINYDGTIIKGHQRRTVMMDMGITEAEVVVLDIRDKGKEKQANIALNKITGQWDLEKLKTLLVDLDLEGYDFTVTGFKQDELEDIIKQLDIPPEAQDDDFDPDAAKEAITEPVTVRGDIWKLGNHRLMCGDATLEGDVEALLAGELLDLVITDPPYNVDYEAKDKSLEKSYKRNQTRKSSKVENDKMGLDTFYCFLLTAFRNMNYAMRPGAGIYVFHADINGLYFRQAYAEAGLKLAQCLIWEKNNFVLGHNDYQWRHEPILYGWKEGAAHYFIRDRSQDTVLLEEEQDLKGMGKRELLAFIENYIRQYKDLTTVHFEPKPQKSNQHPTMKPIPLIGRLMNNSSKPGWTVGGLFRRERHHPPGRRAARPYRLYDGNGRTQLRRHHPEVGGIHREEGGPAMSDLDGLSLEGFDLGAALGIQEPEAPTPAPGPAPEQGGIKVSHRMGARQLWRKAASEKALEEAINWHFQEGDCYHCFSFGDVDSFSFFKMVLRQQHIKYAAISTWCMAGEDVKDLRKWHSKGLIDRVDFFMGEIFKGSYPDVYAAVLEFIEECGGRLVIFRNHSKVMAIEGDRFDCLIESSANVNTNPRSENTVVTVDRDLVGAYIKLFSEIIPFNKNYGAEPYTRDPPPERS